MFQFINAKSRITIAWALCCTALLVSGVVLADEPPVCTGDSPLPVSSKVKSTNYKKSVRQTQAVVQSVYPARITAVEGRVHLLARGGSSVSPAALVVGDVVHLSDVIQTGVQSFVSIRLGDGAQMVLPSNTRFQLTQVNSHLARVKLLDGQVESYVPPTKASRKNKYEIQTPAVVLGVRGTHFRVGYDASTRVTTASVLEGVVMLNSLQCAAPLALHAGEGVRMNNTIPEQATPLLAAPILTESARDAQVGSEVRFKLNPVVGAVQYHAELSRDVRFLDKFKEVFSDAPDMLFESIPMGFYYVRVTAIDANGIEGRFSDTLFLRNSK